MQNLFIFLVVLVFHTAYIHADVSLHSAVRKPSETGSQAMARYKQRLGGFGILNSTDRVSPMAKAFSEDDFEPSSVTVEYLADDLDRAFEFVRDRRFLKWSRNPDFVRRSTWLYPDDGCYARAELMNSNLDLAGFQKAQKVFVFGSLNALTPNHPGGKVSWWYHVAPIVNVNGEAFVLDPAVEPEEALILAEWLDRIRFRDTKVTIAICAPDTYVPSDDCVRPRGGNNAEATRSHGTFLNDEWNRLVSLGRDPKLELGDRPPWAP